MIDKDIILGKAEKVRQHLKRVKDKRPDTLKGFLSNPDLQDIVLFNLQMAIQNCIDMASHLISDEGLGLPGSTNEMFYLLQDNGYIPKEVADKMVAAVGIRNPLVHEYGKMDLEEVYKISHDHTDDLLEFLRALFKGAGLAQGDS